MAWRYALAGVDARTHERERQRDASDVGILSGASASEKVAR
jgi:hypothetical protein